MENKDNYVDVYGLNYEGLDKEQALTLFESFIKDKQPLFSYNLDLQSYQRNDGTLGFMWCPCIAMSYALDESEVCRLYPKNQE